MYEIIEKIIIIMCENENMQWNINDNENSNNVCVWK